MKKKVLRNGRKSLESCKINMVSKKEAENSVDNVTIITCITKLKHKNGPDKNNKY